MAQMQKKVITQKLLFQCIALNQEKLTHFLTLFINSYKHHFLSTPRKIFSIRILVTSKFVKPNTTTRCLRMIQVLSSTILIHIRHPVLCIRITPEAIG